MEWLVNLAVGLESIAMKEILPRFLAFPVFIFLLKGLFLLPNSRF